MPTLAAQVRRVNDPWKFKVSNQDSARLIAERVARRLASDASFMDQPNQRSTTQRHAEPHRARIVNFVSPAPPPRTEPSIGSQPKAKPEISGSRPEVSIDIFESRPAAPQVAQSPWLAPFARAFDKPFRPNDNPQSAIRNQESVDHPSAERFGVEEAAVSELVEFFEAEKQCTVDPSGKPCDHCAMCSSRGF